MLHSNSVHFAGPLNLFASAMSNSNEYFLFNIKIVSITNNGIVTHGLNKQSRTIACNRFPLQTSYTQNSSNVFFPIRTLKITCFYCVCRILLNSSPIFNIIFLVSFNIFFRIAHNNFNTVDKTQRITISVYLQCFQVTLAVETTCLLSIRLSV